MLLKVIKFYYCDNYLTKIVNESLSSLIYIGITRELDKELLMNCYSIYMIDT